MADTEVVLGALAFGARIDEAESMDLLDEFVELGGVWIDTANNYSFWLDPSGRGGQSETVIGRWLAKRPGMRDRVRISTKAGAGDRYPEIEGLSGPVLRAALEQSLERLQTDRVDLYWAHVEDRATPLAETVATMGEFVEQGRVARLGVSNTPSWRVEQARSLAREQGVAGYTAIQLRWSYLLPRPGAPLPESGHVHASPEALDHARSECLWLWAYNTLLNGAYTRADRPLPEAYDHPGTLRRLAALDEVAAELGATRNQVVLARLWADPAPIAPIVGVTTAAQLREAMAARRLELTPARLARLDAAS